MNKQSKHSLIDTTSKPDDELRGGVWGMDRVGEGNYEMQSSSYEINVTQGYSIGSIVSNMVTMLCGDRWELDSLW